MDPKILAAQREIIEAFNSKPKNGLKKIKELLQGEEHVDIEKEIAEFFIKNKNNLDLEAVGDYLSGPEAECSKVLTAFTGMIYLQGQSFTDGLRTFLKAFKLPGEGQKIDRLMESFGTAFHVQNPNLVADKDAAYLLAVQTVMINTNLHNPSVKEGDKYTVDKLVSILRGVNGGKDFDRELIRGIYDNIKTKPFEFNFVKTAPGYQLNSGTLYKDSTFKKMDSLLQYKASPQETFSGISTNVKATVDTPKSWLNGLTGYEGTITLKDDQTKAEVSVQVYKPGFFSKWLFGEKPKVIIQPVHQEGVDPKVSMDLAAKIAAGFKSEVTVKSTYDYEKEDLLQAYQENKETLQTEASKRFSETWKEGVGEEREQQNDVEQRRDFDI